MKEMKQKIPFTEKPKNQIDSILNINLKNQFSKFDKPNTKEFHDEDVSHYNFHKIPSIRPSQRI